MKNVLKKIPFEVYLLCYLIVVIWILILGFNRLSVSRGPFIIHQWTQGDSLQAPIVRDNFNGYFDVQWAGSIYTDVSQDSVQKIQAMYENPKRFMRNSVLSDSPLHSSSPGRALNMDRISKYVNHMQDPGDGTWTVFFTDTTYYNVPYDTAQYYWLYNWWAISNGMIPMD